MSERTPGIAIIKKDAIDDGLADKVIATLASHNCLEILKIYQVKLDIDDASAIYAPESNESDSDERRLLMDMGIRAMIGINLYITLAITTTQSNDLQEGMRLLNAIKGKSSDDPSKGTIRGLYKAYVDSEVMNDVHLYGPHIVRNRIHVPDTNESYSACKAVLDGKVVSYENPDTSA